MKLNAKGKELYKIWEQHYLKENDRLGGNSAEGDFVDGWCIIDNYDYLNNLTDECGLWIYGYDDDAINHIEECIEMYGVDNVIFKDITGKCYTCAEMKAELLKYFE